MEKYGFVYLWFDSYRTMYYIGCHWGHENDGYICSSNRMRDAYRRRPQDFKRRILKSNIERQNLLEEEYKWLTLIKNEELGKRYYNNSRHHFGHWSQYPSKVQSMRERNLGVNNPMYGKVGNRKGSTHREESKRLIRLARANQVITEETKKKISISHLGENNHFYGKKHSEETRLKMAISVKNRKKRVS